MKEYIFARPNVVTLKEAMHDAYFRGEVIRCKDCKYYYEKEWVVGKGSYTTCWYQTIANAHPNDFCSRAEREDE